MIARAHWAANKNREWNQDLRLTFRLKKVWGLDEAERICVSAIEDHPLRQSTQTRIRIHFLAFLWFSLLVAQIKTDCRYQQTLHEHTSTRATWWTALTFSRESCYQTYVITWLSGILASDWSIPACCQIFMYNEC